MSDLDLKTMALTAIREEAEKLLSMPLPIGIRDAAERIASIARYQIDVQTAAEQEATRT